MGLAKILGVSNGEMKEMMAEQLLPSENKELEKMKKHLVDFMKANNPQTEADQQGSCISSFSLDKFLTK